VRAKNTTEILTKNVALFAIACIMYMLCGYGIMYGRRQLSPEINWSFMFRRRRGRRRRRQTETYYAPAADFFFQVVFVATAMSIVSGAVAERMKLWAFLALRRGHDRLHLPRGGHWTWGGGFGCTRLGDLGFLDFAGSGIVHLAAPPRPWPACCCSAPRKGKYRADGSINAIPGANLPLATLGTFILWLGWFGFNGGSVLATASVESANAVAVVFVNTNMAAAGGLVGR
jgi:Amt family ammonium transporter